MAVDQEVSAFSFTLKLNNPVEFNFETICNIVFFRDIPFLKSGNGGSENLS